MAGNSNALRLAAIGQQPGTPARNVLGRNGFSKFRERFFAFALEHDESLGSEHHDTMVRHRQACEQLYQAIKDGSDPQARVAALRVWFEQLHGKPKEVSWLDLAEHLRQVCRDQVEIGRQLIGKQAETWSPEQIRAFWDLCERDPSRFLRAAEEQLAPQQALASVESEPAQLPAAEPATLDAEDDEP